MKLSMKMGLILQRLFSLPSLVLSSFFLSAAVLLAAAPNVRADEGRRFARAVALFELANVSAQPSEAAQPIPPDRAAPAVFNGGDWELADVVWVNFEALSRFPFPTKPSRRNRFVSHGPMPFSLSFKDTSYMPSSEAHYDVTLQIKEASTSANLFPGEDQFPVVKTGREQGDLVFNYAGFTYRCRHKEILQTKVLLRSSYEVPVGLTEAFMCKVNFTEENRHIGFLGFTKVKAQSPLAQ